jgi:predicted acyl esterase
MDRGYDLAAGINDDFARVDEVIKKDVIAFESGPLGQSIEITGVPKFNLHVASDSPWFQLNVVLQDVAPDGLVSYITRGNVGRRNIEAGKLGEVVFDGVAISYRIESGHRLRLEISNTSYPVIVPYFEGFLCRVFHDGKLPSSFSAPTMGS